MAGFTRGWRSCSSKWGDDGLFNFEQIGRDGCCRIKAMSLYQTPTEHSDSILRPVCSWCGSQMMLARIEPAAPDFEKRTFECARCHEFESVVVQENRGLG
jgi:hypothetical protein